MNSFEGEGELLKKKEKLSVDRTAIRNYWVIVQRQTLLYYSKDGEGGRTRSVSCPRNHYLTSTSAYSATRKKE